MGFKNLIRQFSQAIQPSTGASIGSVAYKSVGASTAITGTQENETNFSSSYTIPANTLIAGSKLYIRAQGIHTATTGTETHTILLKLGSTTIASKTLVDPANNDIFYFDFEIIVRTAGSGGTMVGCGVIATGPSGTAACTAASLASTALNTTTAQTVAVAIDRQTTATDSDSVRLDFMTVEVAR